MAWLPSNEELEAEVKQLREELEQLKQEWRRENADPPSTRSAQHDHVDRRQFLKKAGALSAAGIGASLFANHAAAYQLRSGNPFTVADQSGNPHFEVGTDGTLDLQGNDITNVGAFAADQLSKNINANSHAIENIGTLDADGVNSDRSGRFGRLVYYNPADRGPYTDGQDALADVPDGGTLVIAAGTDYDVASEGRLVLSDRYVDIRGEGWMIDSDKNIYGTNLVNTGSDVIDSPVVEIEGNGVTGGGNTGSQLLNLHIEHEGASSFAVRTNDVARYRIDKIGIDCGNAGLGGIQFDGASFLNRVEYSFMRRFTDYGIQITGSGNTHYVGHSHCSSVQDNAVGVETRRQWTTVVGGQYNVNATGGIGIRFYNAGSSGLNGGLVAGATAEEGTALEIDGDTDSFREIIATPIFSSAETAVRFGNSANCHIGVVRHAGEIAHWTVDSRRDTVYCSYGDAARSYTDDGASYPAIKVWNGNLNDGHLSAITTSGGVPVIVPFSADHNGPVVFDGTDWREFSSTMFTP